MAPTPKLSTRGVVDAALGIVDNAGFDALTVSSVANHLSVAPSALYTYCDNLNGLLNMGAVASTNQLARGLRDAAIGTSGDAALQSMGVAYRDYALSHPGRFAATMRPPSNVDDELASANEDLVEIFSLVFHAMGHNESQAHLAARSTRSALHGFLALENSSGSTDAHDDEYQHLLAALQRGMAV
jgi:AcrR family transcriptional regulator